MGKLGRVLLLIIVLGLPAFVYGEFYKYVDEQGHVQFTDNLANVPADQRKQVEQYEESHHRPEGLGRSADDTVDAGSAENTANDVTKPAGEPGPSEQGEGAQGPTAKQLQEEAANLKAEYEALITERQELEQKSSKRIARAARIALDRQIADFNVRFKDYERRRDAHNKAVKTHNARVVQPTAPQSP